MITELVIAHPAVAVADVPARVQRALEFIEQNLAEPWLNPQAVAAAQGISRRHLDALFASRKHRLQEFIWERRLQRAARQLAADASCDSNRSILQIALDAGFKTHSHFSRAFSRRFGVSPREFRRAAGRERLVQPE